MTVRTAGGWVGGKHFGTWLAGVQADQAIAVQSAVTAAAEGLKNELRDAVSAAGLGDRLGNAIGANVYPRGKYSLNAAGYVFPRGKKAAAIFDSFNAGSVITAHKGRYLAIPTKDAGRGYHFMKATPQEFQDRTGIRLRLVRFKKGTLALVGDAIAGRNGRGFRRASAGRLAQGRRAAPIVFFILVPVARMPHRLNFEAIAASWSDRIPDLIAAANQGEGDA